MTIISHLNQEQIIGVLEEALTKSLKKLDLVSESKQDRYISRELAAQISQVTPATIHNRIHKGIYKTKRNGRYLLISLKDVLEILSNQEIEEAKKLGLLDPKFKIEGGD